MSLWGDHVSPLLQHVSEEKRKLFALTCVDHAFAIICPRLVGYVHPSKIQMAKDAINYFWMLNNQPSSWKKNEDIINQLESFFADAEEDSTEVLLSGWSELLNALVCILTAIHDQDVSTYSAEASAQAYYAVTRKAIANSLPSGGIAEPQLTELELTTPICQEEIAFQVEWLRRIESGELPIPSCSAQG